MLPSNSIEQLLSFEKNIEDGFVAVLSNAGLPSVQSSRGRTDTVSPRISLWFQNGTPKLENQHKIEGLPGRLLPFNSYTGTLTLEIVTSRTSDSPSHTLLIAQVRTQLQMFNLFQSWPKYQDISLIGDIREAGCAYEWDDENGLDTTTMNWNLWHSLNPAAWPEINIA